MAEPMTPKHPRWDEFAEVLAGPTACDFRDVGGELTWNCKGGTDKTYARSILLDMGFDPDVVAASLDEFEDHGGYCDCEILFNVADHPDYR